MGMMLDRHGDHAGALEALGKALAIYEQVLGADHKHTRQARRVVEKLKR